MTVRLPGLVVGVLLVPAMSALAQEPQTRAEALRAEREAKSQALEPHQPNGLERAMDFIEGTAIPLLQRDGFYARMGSLSTGSGFAYGGGYRNHRLFARRGSVDLWAAGSLKSYWTVEARTRFPDLAGGRVGVEGWVRRFDYPSEEFFGIGPASERSDRSNYGLDGTLAGASAWLFPRSIFRAGGSLEYQTPHLSTGGNESLPDVGDLFSPEEAPGLRSQPAFLNSTAFVEVDYRRPLYARRGGWYRLTMSRHDDRETGHFSFRRLDLDLRQFVSVLAERRVFAGRAYLTTTDVEDGREIPFYLLPAVGGHDTLRGFRTLRFRGPHAIVLQGEYRWEIWSGFDAALFYDTGKVALRRSDLDLRDLEKAYGFGFRFNTNDGVIMRVDAGFGSSDGRHLYVVFGGVF
jgi:hypothetical protein